ncbi:hypothetical protein GCM10027035_41240 [Emticicia sediminis]
MNSKKQTSCIYIGCIASFATGGTELLHQLGEKLKKMNIPVKMYYYNQHFLKEKPVDFVADRFKKYGLEYVTDVDDIQDNLIIIPEVATFLISKFQKAELVLWWLSIDFFLKSKAKQSNFLFKRASIVSLLKGKFEAAKWYWSLKTVDPFKELDRPVSHWVQSYYAYNFLIKNCVKEDNVHYLSDYLSETFIHQAGKVESHLRQNAVLYNPAKGQEITKRLMNLATHIKFIPLQNMTPTQVAELMRTAKVYIDFGNHPGKDRIPREAAISGCVVITNKEGSAGFYKDVPIDEKYKFDYKEGFERDVVKLIDDIFLNFDLHTILFDEYRQLIKQEETNFNNDLKNIFLQKEIEI